MIETSGTPFQQGRAQGSALHGRISEATAALRRQYGPISWKLAISEAHRGAARRVKRFLPQQHERLEGIAAGARVSVGAIELFDGLCRVSGVGCVFDQTLEARLELSSELATLLTLRRSLPDAGGFASVELTSAPWMGCLAGVNDRGVGVVVLEDRGLDGPSIRVLAQDLVYRVQSSDAGVDHARLRGRYTRISGLLLMADDRGEKLRLRFDDGALEVCPEEPPPTPPLESTLRIDTAQRKLVWSAPDGDHGVCAAAAGAEAADPSDDGIAQGSDRVAQGSDGIAQGSDGVAQGSDGIAQG